jgi:uncharacterized protein YbjT (DUF2867 family)
MGAYGLIGVEVFNLLKAKGHHIMALGRNEETAKKVLPHENWIIRDISKLIEKRQWTELISETDFVVNCAGVLQTNRFDDLENLHHHAITALATAGAELVVGLIQISAVGATLDADTEFLASKARGDDSIRTSLKRYWIFKPGLVLSNTAYGGTQLIRMCAAIPYVQPLAFETPKIQTLAVTDLALAVAKAVDGELPIGLECDLVEAKTHSLQDIISSYRKWLGFPVADFNINCPQWSIHITSIIADGLGFLGWRSPLRTTAIKVLKNGVIGTHDPSVLAHTRSLDETLTLYRATAEDRLFARMALLMPIVIGLLSVFWIASGVIGLLRVNMAAEVLTDIGWPFWLASLSVLFWAIIDVALGGALLVRKYSKLATLGMILVSVLYLLFSTIFVPNLWLDPLGPLVKILPSIGLALIARVLLETR